MSPKPLKKGEHKEEILRQYFLSLGYFVVRSINFQYRQFDVTDIDLWLYSRSSPISRERTNVDIKNKSTPKALERIFWTKGLKEVLGLEKCIVATTDKRQDVIDFGVKNDVLVLDGKFLSKLDSSDRFTQSRITEEDFISCIDHASLGELGGSLKKRYEKMKSHFIHKMNFDGVNEFLNEATNFLKDCDTENKSEASLRLLYISLAYFLICLDFSVKDFSYKEHEERSALISEGIRYGEDGKKKSEELVAMSSALVTSFLNADQFDKKALEDEVNSQFKHIASEGVSDYFSKTKVMSQLFSIAKSFESAAFEIEVLSPSQLSTELQSVIALIADYDRIDRKRILS